MLDDHSETRPAGYFSAADIKRRMAQREAEKAAEELRRMKEQEEKQKAVMAEFHAPPDRTPEQLMQLVMQLVTRAAERGETEVQVYRFPNELCTDRGRRINNSEPEWEQTLEGRPKLGYEFWRDHLRPLGFGLKAAVVEYPGGYARRHRLFSHVEMNASAGSGAGTTARMPWWAWVWPLLAWGLLAATFVGGVGGAVVVAAEVVVLIATVFAAVWHAEVVAHRVGEPFGTLVLALAVTVIEVALIVSVMLAGKAGSETLARDTAFATLMIILNGIVGLGLLLGGVLHREQEFQVKGASAALAVLAALVTLSFALPNFTTTVAGPAYSPSQLVFAGTVSLVLYGVFIFVQTERHRDYFLPDPKRVWPRTRRRMRRHHPALRRSPASRCC